MFNSGFHQADTEPLTDTELQLLRQIARGSSLTSANNVYLLENWPVAGPTILALIERGYLTAESPHTITVAGQRALHSR